MSSRSSSALLVPCRNGAAFLPRLAASARAQTRPFDEWWLFDDGSTDNSADIARNLGFKVLAGERSRGPSAARNALVRATQCEWIHFHDADDLMAGDYLAASLEAAHGEIDLVICDMPWVDEETGALVFHWRYDEKALRANPYASLLTQTIGGINALYRRSKFVAVGGFDEKRAFWEDLDLSLRLFHSGVRFCVLNRDLVTALRRNTSYSNRGSDKVWTGKIELMTEWLEIEPAAVSATVAREAEAIAIRLMGLDEFDKARQALQLCSKAGGHPPTTENRTLRVLKWVLPSFAVFRLQHLLRRFASPSLSQESKTEKCDRAHLRE